MRARATETIAKFQMLSKEDSVLVGISGGADSVALLHFLRNFKELKLNVLACHINHNIRGEEAHRDEQFVRELCEQIGVSLFVRQANALEIAKKTGKSVEEAARNVRYKTFEELAITLNAKIATAHNLGDSIETVVLNMARGTGLKGLCGIAPTRDRIIRPFVFITRGRIKQYLSEHSLDFVNDSSNEDLGYFRNRVRREIVPQLFMLNSSFETVFERMCENLTEDESFLQSLADKEFFEIVKGENIFCAKSLREMQDSVMFRVLRRILSEAEVTCDAKRIALIKQAVISGRGKVTLTKGKFCSVSSGLLRIEEVRVSSSLAKFEQPVKFPGKYYACEEQILWLEVLEYTEFEKKQARHDLMRQVLDLDKISGMIKMRGRKPGDAIRLSHINCKKTVKKIFNENKVPSEQRARCIMLEDEEGLVWIDGFGADKRVAITNETKRVLLLEVEK